MATQYEGNEGEGEAKHEGEGTLTSPLQQWGEEWCIDDDIIRQLESDGFTLKDLANYTLADLQKLLTDELKVSKTLYRTRFTAAVESLPDAKCKQLQQKPEKITLITEVERQCVHNLSVLFRDITVASEKVQFSLKEVNKSALKCNDTIKTTFDAIIGRLFSRRRKLLKDLSAMQQSKINQLTQQLAYIGTIENQIASALKKFKAESHSEMNIAQRQTTIIKAEKLITQLIANEKSMIIAPIAPLSTDLEMKSADDTALHLIVEPCVSSTITLQNTFQKISEKQFQIVTPPNPNPQISATKKPKASKAPKKATKAQKKKEKQKSQNLNKKKENPSVGVVKAKSTADIRSPIPILCQFHFNNYKVKVSKKTGLTKAVFDSADQSFAKLAMAHRFKSGIHCFRIYIGTEMPQIGEVKIGIRDASVKQFGPKAITIGKFCGIGTNQTLIRNEVSVYDGSIPLWDKRKSLTIDMCVNIGARLLEFYDLANTTKCALSNVDFGGIEWIPFFGWVGFGGGWIQVLKIPDDWIGKHEDLTQAIISK